jgi:hypothetical protein
MFGALLIHIAVIATPATATDALHTNCASVHCSATLEEHAQNQSKQPTENCAGVHCAPTADKSAQSDTRYGAENLDNARVSSGYDTQTQRYGSSGADRSFDTAHDTRYDRTGYDNSGTWPAH